MLKNKLRSAPICTVFGLFLAVTTQFVFSTDAQTVQTSVRTDSSLSLYLDLQNGMTVGEAVVFALKNNGEIQALVDETKAAESLVRQAGLRANPKVDVNVARQIGGMHNNVMVGGMLPLELGGRRTARIEVARAELELKQFALANQERLLASEVRQKFGQTIGNIKKLEIIEKLIANTKHGFEIITAKVNDGRTAPLEQNMLLVELNRLYSMRETAEGKVETSIFELRNLLGMKPETPVRLRGDFDNLSDALPPVDEALVQALRQRPDLQGARTIEKLAAANVVEARVDSKIDASVKAGYQRMKSGFPLNGITETGELAPINGVSHYLTFGIEIDMPVRNRNQGKVEAGLLMQESAKKRVEFGELTIGREVNIAFSRFNRALRSMRILQNGVRDQAGTNLQVIWQTYEFGKTDLSVYLAEERRFLEIENELIDALLETYLARIEILQATNSAELKQ